MKTLLSILLVSIVATAFAGDRPVGKMFATRSDTIARNGMAATSHPMATTIALDILKKGGTAVDAAIAANACLALMEPMSCGLGGDLFAIVWSAEDERLYGLNASGRSPQELTLEYFKTQELSTIPDIGPLSVSVPGAVDGWFELHRKFGRLAMSELLQPTIEYAMEGFPVSPVIASYWKAAEELGERFPSLARTFLIDGKAPQTGELFRNQDLARVLRMLAEEGRDAFYRGDIARSIASFCEREGSFLRYEDLANHTSTWTDPVSTTYRGHEVWELPPNGQGIAALQMLNILEAFDLKAMGHNSASYLHHLVEAKKLAFEDRARFYADPDFNQIPVSELISKAYAEKRRVLIDPKKAARSYPSGNPRMEQGDTIYLTVADKDRNMVSLIQSNFMGFGSGLVPEGTGFPLQNRGALFTLEEGHLNVYEPGKRPFHTIIPAFVTRNGKPYISFGVMGGDMQPQGHVQVLCNVIDFGMSLQEAGDAARFRHFGSSSPTGGQMEDGGALSLESGVDAEAVRGLSSMGHRIQLEMGGYGGYQAILYDARNDAYWGASESRKDGMAAGY